MTDVSHELGALRHIVESPLSSKVAMFNKVADSHHSNQLLNPFSNVRGSSPGRPVFSKEEYGKPLAGSLTEMRGQKANIHVCKEMLELCQVIDSEGFSHPENPDLKVIFFGDLFNIYNRISDKCVGLLLRARKHKLLDFEGEMLFQRRDDEVPIITTKPILEIRRYLEGKQEEFRRSVSPAPRATSVIQDNMKRAASQTPSTSPLASKCGTPRSLSPVPIAESKVYSANEEPKLRQIHSTPDLKLGNKSIENLMAEENSSDTSPVKVAMFLTKAPVVECLEVKEKDSNCNEMQNNKIENPEILIEEPRKPKEEVNDIAADNKIENISIEELSEPKKEVKDVVDDVKIEQISIEDSSKTPEEIKTIIDDAKIHSEQKENNSKNSSEVSDKPIAAEDTSVQCSESKIDNSIKISNDSNKTESENNLNGNIEKMSQPATQEPIVPIESVASIKSEPEETKEPVEVAQ